MSVSYTQAGFEVASQYVDTNTKTSKVLYVPNPDWAKDYAVIDIAPSEASYFQTSGGSLTQYEVVRIGRKNIPDIYSNTGTLVTRQLPDKRGVQVLLKLDEVYRATSAATGQDYDLPFSIHTVLRMPYNAIVNNSIVYDILLRLIAMYGTTRSGGDFTPVNECRTIADAVRGDLQPYRIMEL